VSVKRYMVSAQVIVDASPDRAYAVASDPDLIPQYENGISRIEVIEQVGPLERVVRSTLRIFGTERQFIYRYRYSPGRHYSGVQQEGAMVRGFFSFAFSATGAGTCIVHREGVFSRVPFAAATVGFLYFTLLGRNGISSELARLKHLIETTQ
jgi:hypothetical protein